ncbi:MAG TPA: hypothetical protein PKD83_03835 [Ignavibacteria bacterium]|nr:hypothetical protein [Ignavibacteria bacterium]
MHREEILSKIIKELLSYPQINILAEGGAKAFNRYDELSDIDLMADTEDGSAEGTVKNFENFLTELTGIESVYTVSEKKDFYHKFYKLNNISKFWVIDLFIVERSNPAKELELQIHGDLVIHYDKYDYIKKQKFNLNEYQDKIKTFGKRSKAVFEFFQYQTEKEIMRGHYIDALAYYFDLTLKPLIRLLRIKFNPMHYNFELRYLYDEFPGNIVKEIETLMEIKGLDDLKLKQKIAVELYKREIDSSYSS